MNCARRSVSISGHAQQLSEQPLPPTLQPPVALIEAEAKRMGQLLRVLLELARNDSGRSLWRCNSWIRRICCLWLTSVCCRWRRIACSWPLLTNGSDADSCRL